MGITFGDFVLDIDRRLLLRGAEAIHLAPKAFDLLRVLVEQRPRVLSKTDLMKHVWRDTFVTENNLATLITDLRAALGDDPREGRMIRTAHGVGYAFAAAAVDDTQRPAPQQSNWKLIWKGTELRLADGDNILGRPADGVVGLESPTVSRHHARIRIAGGVAVIEDLGSKNGTWLGAMPVAGPATLKDGDELRLGSVLVTVRRVWSETSTLTLDGQPDVSGRRRGDRRRTPR